MVVENDIERTACSIGVFGHDVAIIDVVRATGLIAYISAEVMEAEILVPLALGLCAVEVGHAVITQPPTELLTSISQRDFSNLGTDGKDYALSIGRHLIEPGTMTNHVIERAGALGKVATKVGSWLLSRAAQTSNSTQPE